MSVLDFHAWIEINGKIIDWDMKSKNLKSHLTFCASINNRDRDFTPIYVEWTEIDDKTQKVLDKMINERKEGLDMVNLVEGKDGIKKVWNMLKNEPRCCLNRALLLKHKNPSAILKVGSLGLKDKKGNIWYEYGNGSHKSIDKVKHIKV